MPTGTVLGSDISPDGQTIAFDCYDGDRAAVCLMAADGSQIRQISPPGAFARMPRFSPSGDQVLYRGDTRLVIVDVALATEPRPIVSTQSADNADWAPAPGEMPAGARIADATPTPVGPPVAISTPIPVDGIPTFFPTPVGPPFEQQTTIGGCTIPAGSVEITPAEAAQRGQRVFQVLIGQYLYLRADGTCVSLGAGPPIPAYAPEGDLDSRLPSERRTGLIGPNAGTGTSSELEHRLASVLGLGISLLMGGVVWRRARR
jgi:hypothetical protein